VEQRQHNRYPLTAAVTFSWETASHSPQSSNGITRDCGLSGAFVVSPNRLPVGSILQMDFSLPPLLAAGRGARLRTRGRVVRNELEGFAVVADMGPASLLHGERDVYALAEDAKVR